MQISKQEIYDLLLDKPVLIGNWVGFKDLTELHNEWLKSFLYRTDDQTLQGHRGSYKTTTLSLFFALHMIMKPYETTLFFRKTETDVAEVVRQTQNILKTGCVRKLVKDLYGVDFALIKASNGEINTNLNTRITGASQLVGLGIGTSITGKHADIVVTDDIVNVKDRISSAEREHTKIAYMELQNIKNRGGRFINTGTPWHKEDCFTLMPEANKYDCYSTGLISKAKLEDLRDHMAPSLFAANYELKHIAAEDVLFTDPVLDGDPEKIRDGICHLDSAFYGSDYTAFTVLKMHDGKPYMYGTMWRRHVEDCYPDIINLYKQFKCSKLYTERNADKGMVARDLRNLGLSVAPYDESMNKHMKIATYLKAVWKDITWIEGTDMNYLEQICDYTEDAEHDDAPDSAASIVRVVYPKIGKQEYIPMFMGGVVK